VIVAITGASGFVGRHATALLRRAGHEILAVSTRGLNASADFAGCNAVVNLAGEPVAQRWTAQARERIRSSRVDGTRRVVEALAALNPRPTVLINASAIGIYGPRGDEILTESSAPASDFLGQVASEWEREATAAEKFGMRVATLRFGIVLGRDGGALEKMLLPFKLGIGGKLGDGSQWMSWIHIDDVVGLVEFAMANPVRGALNATSPNPVRNVEFTRELARALHRPAIFPVPKFALSALFGEMSETILASQRVIPATALRAGFAFKFPELRGALENILAVNKRE
jgi:uncharacterized protein (TIGR01777 family)